MIVVLNIERSLPLPRVSPNQDTSGVLPIQVFHSMLYAHQKLFLGLVQMAPPQTAKHTLWFETFCLNIYCHGLHPMNKC